ncbi:ATP-binding cassette domain-containing protein [Nostoc sp. LEGE 06077]|uniref:ABC transporter ATP-binding protein n=1 Tax=Nostoc sp. LEGE 06077 TaxID=915325 RepID=UPI00187DE771|nr:ABC transporter ATP-binding protein [Nostoc sp. LEGE 06077]MBE9207145.1 ATP-binding cassette domain-containing protein [Nostoc sp. LEGE 06077]
MMEDIISVKNLSMAYPVYSSPKSMFLEMVTGKIRHDLFWALQDVSFTIKAKQKVGIIGPNGSGKSTLLKIITGNLKPTSGQLEVNGNISAMLSLTSFLNPEETGLENIRFNLIMNGCPKEEIEVITEEIIEFTELGHFIYAPVKTYSSGMNAKLAFAITTAIKPEILVVDEILSVGDAYFMGKATKRMIDLCDQGKGLIFVSHATSAVQMLCDTVIWLDNGSLREMGEAEYVLNKYEEDYRKREDEATRIGNMAKKHQSKYLVSTLENPEANILILRLVSNQENCIFADTHYIRHIKLSSGSLEDLIVPLTLQNVEDPNVPIWLDLLESEWGRLYSKDGYDCRILSAKSGKKTGGYIFIKVPPANLKQNSYTLNLLLESQSILNKEKIDIEFINYKIGTWQKADKIEYQNLKDGWESTMAKLEIPCVSDEEYQLTLNKIQAESKPDIEIEEIKLTVNGEDKYTIDAHQSFAITVTIFANRLVSVADVGIKITRSDGVHTFWQSSGLKNHNLHNISGKFKVCFKFNENYLAAGEYSVSAYCANGWNYENNFPYSEVLARNVSGLKFKVNNEFPGVCFGLINIQVPVEYIKEDI